MKQILFMMLEASGSSNVFRHSNTFSSIGNVGIRSAQSIEKSKFANDMTFRDGGQSIIRNDLRDWSDYTFKKNYQLPILKDVKEYISKMDI